MWLFLLWVFFCFAAALFAHVRRNRFGAGWFLVAFFFSPLVAFVLLAILQPLAADRLAIEHGNDNHPVYPTAPLMPGLLIVIGMLLIFGFAIAKVHAGEQQQIFRDASGRTTMTATQSGNQTTYRDADGHTIGTTTIGSSGQQHNIRKGR